MNDHEQTETAHVITDVQTQQRRAERRSIFIDGEYAFGVSEEIYVKYALYQGRRVTAEFLEEVRRQEELYQARLTAMRFLARRMRSVKEIEEKLAGKKYSPEAIAGTMRFLAEYRMIDDDEFARAYINDQLLRRPVGKRRLEMELRRKGVEKEAASGLLSGMIDEEEELRNAMAAAEKKARTLRSDDPRKWDRTMSGFLASRGFGWEVIGKVMGHYREERRQSGAEPDEIDENTE